MLAQSSSAQELGPGSALDSRHDPSSWNKLTRLCVLLYRARAIPVVPAGSGVFYSSTQAPPQALWEGTQFLAGSPSNNIP